jgi:hypothetical protein
VTTYVIDECGDVWVEGRRDLMASVGARCGDSTAAPVMHDIMGFVSVRIDRKILQVKLRADIVTNASFAALLYLIHDQDDAPIVLLSAQRGNVPEMFRSRHDFILRLIELKNQTALTTGRNAARFLTRPLPVVDQDSKTSLDGVRAVLNYVPRVEDMADIFGGLFRQRYVIAEQSPESDAIQVLRMGVGYRAFDTDWYDRVVGRSLLEYSDTEYGQWVSEAYGQAFATMTPRYDAVDARVRWPRIPLSHSRYRRLVVPIVRSDGRRLALITTTSDLNIDLRQ